MKATLKICSGFGCQWGREAVEQKPAFRNSMAFFKSMERGQVRYSVLLRNETHLLMSLRQGTHVKEPPKSAAWKHGTKGPHPEADTNSTRDVNLTVVTTQKCGCLPGVPGKNLPHLLWKVRQ